MQRNHQQPGYWQNNYRKLCTYHQPAHPHQSTVKKLSKAGRPRWKIENEGFNEQKNNGYNIEHLYSSKSFNALQNYYQCMLITHLINQLLEHTCKIKELLIRFKKLTLKYLWQQLMATMKYQPLCTQILKAIDNKKTSGKTLYRLTVCPGTKSPGEKPAP